MSEATKMPACSFCYKSQDKVSKLIAAPGVMICDECVDLCNDIMEEEGSGPWGWVRRVAAWPLVSQQHAIRIRSEHIKIANQASKSPQS